MKYYYADSMFISGKDSACYSPRENYQLSEEDKRRIALFYPKDTAVVADRMREKRETINAVLARVPQASLLARELQRHLQ
jgi:hypothetical protein